MSIIIREARERDFPSLHSLFVEFATFQKTPERVMITLEQMRADKELFKGLVAEANNKKIVGFATYFFTYYSWSGKALYIDDLYVQPAYRGQQIGTRLMEDVFEIARAASCNKVRWQVSKWNIPAIDFYTRLGANVDGTEINCDYFL